MDISPTRRRLRGAAAGLIATALALGVAQFVAAADRRLRSPVVDVGARVIDAAPPWLKTFAIDTFGTNDKPALLIGIVSILFAYAVVIGVVATRHRSIGVAGVAVFAVIGIVAASSGAGERVWWSALPTLLGAIAGGAALWYLAGLAIMPITPIRSMVDGPGPDSSDRGTAAEQREARTTVLPGTASRRGFLLAGASIGAAAVAAGGAGRWLSKRFDVAAARARIRLPGARRPLPALPDGASLDVAGITPFVTPNADFYRIDTALIVPQVPVEGWRLRITGMVEEPIELSYDDLLARDLIESDITLTCVSNEVGGQLAGNARWLGVPLAELLNEAGVKAGADQIVGRSVDGFTAGFPVSAATDGRDAMVAIGMNGEPLPVTHGFPARLVVPGLYGYVSATKWLQELELTTFDRFDSYWARRGWAKEAPIKTFSRIDTPGSLQRLSPGRHPIAGVAWAQLRGIERVEVRVDGGAWADAELSDEVGDTTWRQWVLPYDFAAGRHTVECRATDGKGAIQTKARAEPIPDGASGWHAVVVIAG